MFLRRGFSALRAQQHASPFLKFNSLRAFCAAPGSAIDHAGTVAGVWKTPGSKFDIQRFDKLFVYNEHLRSGATVTKMFVWH